MKELRFLLPVSAYVAVILGSLLVVRLLRPTRWPFKEEERLLCGPGESLRKEIGRIDESFITGFLGGILVLLLAPVIYALLAKQLATGSVGMLFGMVVVARFIASEPASIEFAMTLTTSARTSSMITSRVTSSVILRVPVAREAAESAAAVAHRYQARIAQAA